MDQREVFKKFINKCFLDFQTAQGERITVTQFADAISKRAESGEIINQVFQGDVSHWLHGNRIPGASMLKVLAQSPHIGSGVWQAAGYQLAPDLDPLEEQVLAAMRKMPTGMREEFARMVERKAQQGEKSTGYQFQAQA